MKPSPLSEGNKHPNPNKTTTNTKNKLNAARERTKLQPKGYIYFLNIHTSSEEVCRDEDALLEALENRPGRAEGSKDNKLAISS